MRLGTHISHSSRSHAAPRRVLGASARSEHLNLPVEWDPELRLDLGSHGVEIRRGARGPLQLVTLSRRLPDPPETEDEPEPSATIYFRFTASLKSAIEKAAEQAQLSVNAWLMRCAEGCVQTARAEDCLKLIE